MSTAPPYIGVTGFMSSDEVELVQDMIDPAWNRKLMAGILVSGKTARGQRNKYAYKYPPIEEVRGILSVVDPQRAFGLIHFSSDYQKIWSECRLALDAANLYDSGVYGDQLRGFQYNFMWPDPELVKDINFGFRSRFTGYDTWHILQLGPATLDGSLHSIREGVRRYSPFTGSALPFSYLLIDMSGGRGQELEWQQAAVVLEALLEFTGPRYGLKLAIAGGLSADNLHQLRPMVEIYPDLSIDAEGRLRADDGSLDLDKVKAYVSAAYELFA